jgi:AraC family transcriptional regulator of arabinose operon
MAEDLNDPASKMKESTSPLPGILVAGHFREAFGYSAFRSKGTKDWLITYTLSGCGEYSLYGETYRCEPGDAVLLPPAMPHHYYTPQGCVWEFMWAHFVPEPRWYAILPAADPAQKLPKLHIEASSSRERIRTAMGKLVRDSRGTEPFSELLAMNALEETLVIVAQSFAGYERSLDPRIADTLTYISANLQEKHTVQDLAQRALLSPSRYAHLFKTQVGESVIDTILHLRLRHAARLLEHTAMSISEIASEVGFQSPFYFTKQFTARYGSSPTKFRSVKQGL